MINWDPAAQTALSDEEVIYKEVQSKLYYIEYQVVDSDKKIIIATTRPETILGDTAICINPNDERYKHLKGKKAIVPLINREIPIIFDEYVDMEFGTGCLKVTPAHDLNDYELGIKHNLPSIDILNDDGTLSEAAQLYVGEDRFTVREKIAQELKEKGFLKKVETITNNVGFSERTDAVIEPKLSLQWFCKMDKLAKPALENVMNDNIKFYPSKFKNSYKHWMENIKDWCISRQLWWGQQIPAWYYGDGANDFVVAKTKEEALKLIENKIGKPVDPQKVKQDEDVLDTWFSSWLWPISVFDGFKDPHNKDIEYYYPTNDLVTAPEIMFFWVARMIMAGYEYRGEKPFENVYYTGIVRDKQGRKMSKSLGNSPDPIDLIKKYGADGVRVGMLLSSPAGNDLLFDESLCEQGRNFANKIWNAFRLTRSWTVEEKQQPKYAKEAITWMEENINQKVIELNDAYAKFRISDALMITYRLIWDDFCSWYLEIVKPPFGESIDAETFNQTNKIFEKLLGLLHPFMPFLSEEIWQQLDKRAENETIMFLPWPKSGNVNENILNAFEFAKEIVSGVRTIRKDKQIPNKEKVDLYIKENESFTPDFLSVVKKLGNIDKLEKTIDAPQNAFSFRVKSNEYFVPLGDKINIEEELKKLEEELKYTQGFKQSVEKKLSNERFVNNAPEQVVANERKKLADAEAKIKVLEEQIAALSAKA
jgi:valyl-tRNA synthetase